MPWWLTIINVRTVMKQLLILLEEEEDDEGKNVAINGMGRGVQFLSDSQEGSSRNQHPRPDPDTGWRVS